MSKGLAIAAGVLLCAVHSARADQAAAPIGSIPIAVTVADLAAAAGVHRVDPSTLPLDIVRLAFAAPEGGSAAEGRIRAAVARALDRDGAAAGLIPLPLGPKLWTQRVLGRNVSDGRLAAAIFASRPAALLYHGLMGMEPATLTWIEANPAVLDVLRQHPGVSAVYARSIRIRNGRVVTPGDAADDVWAAVVGVDPGQAAAFVKRLLSSRSGRLAALYDAVAHLDRPRQTFAIGKAGDSGRIERARRLLDAVTRQDPRWKLEEHPFMRSDVDEAFLLRAARVTASGDLAPPASRALWSHMFGGADDGGSIDAGSLVEMILLGGDRTARQRLDLFLFGQRALGSDDGAGTASLVEALEGFRRFPALMLTLETHGLGAAEYATAARAAAALGEDHDAVAVFQSGIAIVDRARRSGTIDASRTRAAIASLMAAAAEGSRGSLIAWVRDGLLEPLRLAVADGAALDADAVVLAAMAGPRGSPGPIITWEGQQFRADPSGAEPRRLSTIRRGQGELPLDGALAAATPRSLAGLARSLAAIVYADALGDPAGQPSGAGQVWRRHRFDGNEAGQPGQPVAWRAAREVFAGDGWHMVGSLLRLDLALAPLALRRLDSTEMPMPSVLATTLRRTLALSVALIDPRALTDDQRDAAAAALVRGRARAASLSKDPAALDAAADTAGLSEWRRNGVRWTLSTDPAVGRERFTLLELFRIGGGDAHAAWGAAATPIDGCLCLRFPERGAWEEFSGRAASGQLATQLPDVFLRAAEALSTRRLPAALTRDVAAFAMQEVLDRARPVYLDDWLPVAFAARDLRDEQFDDYVAALTVAGPLVPVGKGGR